MRNLKRALSLALASVMLLGMMVVGTSAASYPDVDDNDNIEAISVLQAVGVMLGDNRGNFNPDQTVTRNEMAAVMARLLLGTYAAESYTGTHPFTDVPAWADKYVAACYAAGVVNGTSATTFSGSRTVTAIEAAAMMLRALGYEDLSKNADRWDQPVAAKANEINLFTGMNGSGTAKLDRNDVAKLSLNALESNMVRVSRSGYDVQIGNVSMVSYIEYIDRTDIAGCDYNASSDGKLQLCEFLYKKDLEKKAGTAGDADEQKRPASHKWIYDGKEIITVPATATYTLKDGFTAKDLYNTIGSTAAGYSTWAVYVDGDTGTSEGSIDYTVANVKTAVGDKDADTKYAGNGTVTEIFVDSTAKSVTICVIKTHADKVDKVYTDKDVDDDEKPYVLLDESDLKFETTAFDEDDVVYYTKGKDDDGNDVVVTMALAKAVEGEVTKVTETKNFTVNGKVYKYNETMKKEDMVPIGNVGEDAKMYLDGNGYVVYPGETNASTNYAYVVSAGHAEDRYKEGEFTYYAKLLLTDGTLKEVTLKDVTGAESDTDGSAAADAYNGQIVNYTESDGEYKLTVKSTSSTDLDTVSTNDNLKIEKGVAQMKLNSASKNATANNETIFLVCEKDDGKNCDVYVGYKNVPNIKGAKSSSAVAYYVDTESNVAKVVYIQGGNAETGSSDDVIFIIGNEKAKRVETSSGEYFEYDAVVGGKKTTLEVLFEETEEGNITAYDIMKDATVVVAKSVKYNSKSLVTSIEEYEAYDDGDGVKEYSGAGTTKASKGIVGFGSESWGYIDDVLVVKVDGDKVTTGGISMVRDDPNDDVTVVLKGDKVIAVCITVKANPSTP